MRVNLLEQDDRQIREQVLSLPLTAAASTATLTITVATTDDAVDETNGQIIADLLPNTGYTLGLPSSATVIVEDNDAAPALTITAWRDEITEGEVAIWTIHAVGRSANPVTVGLTVTETGEFIDTELSTLTAVRGTTAEFVGNILQIQTTLPAGQLSTTLSIATRDDQQDEPDGRLTATLNPAAVRPGGGTPNPGGGTPDSPTYTISTPAQASVTVRDNDDPIGPGEQARRANELILPQVAMAIADETTWAIQRRVETEFSNRQAEGLQVAGSTPTELVLNRLRQRAQRPSRERTLTGLLDVQPHDLSFAYALSPQPRAANASPPTHPRQDTSPQATMPPLHHSPLEGESKQAQPVLVGGQQAQPAALSTQLAGSTHSSRRLNLPELNRGYSEDGGWWDTLTLWGRGYHHELEVNNPAINFGGTIEGQLLGLDSRRPGFLGGILVTRAEAGMDFTLGSQEGLHTTDLTGIYPYFAWELANGFHVWTTLGYSRGGAEVTLAAATNTRYSRDLQAYTAGLGAWQPLFQWHRRVGDGSSSTRLGFVFHGVGINLAEQDGDDPSRFWASRARGGVELDYRLTLRGGTSLSGNLQVTARRDSGDGIVGSGLETEASLAMQTIAGTRIGLVARNLHDHQRDLREVAYAVDLSWRSNQDGRGLSLAWKPEWGRTGSQREQFWQTSQLNLNPGQDQALRHRAEIEYGIPLGYTNYGTTRLLTLFARGNLTGKVRTVTMGANLKLGKHLLAGYETVARTEHDDQSQADTTLAQTNNLGPANPVVAGINAASQQPSRLPGSISPIRQPLSSTSPTAPGPT